MTLLVLATGMFACGEDPSTDPLGDASDAVSNTDGAIDAAAGNELDGGPNGTVDGASGEPPPDGAVADAGPPLEPDATMSDDGDTSPGETCLDAPSLTAASEEIPPNEPGYTHAVTGALGSANDYNPIQSAGLPPNCSLVFDAAGNEVVYQVVLNPGETMRMRLSLEGSTAIPALYFLDGCPEAGWPDLDGGGLCGDNEYKTDGFCQGGSCRPVVWDFTWPETIQGEPTGTKTLFLVLDELEVATSQDFTLEWVIEAP